MATPPEVAGVLFGVRIGIGLDLPVSADADGAQTDDLIAFQALAGLGADAKDQAPPFIDPVLQRAVYATLLCWAGKLLGVEFLTEVEVDYFSFYGTRLTLPLRPRGFLRSILSGLFGLIPPSFELCF